MTVHEAPSHGHDHDVRRAWWSFALFVPSVVAAFITGEGLLAAMGHSGDQTPPAGTALMAGLPAILVFALPTLLVWHFGHQAEQRGHPEGRTPVIVAVVIAGGFLAMNLVQLVLGLIV
jgi:heme/copper-type cytochrome/quinol oxidase subunit 3